MAMATKQSRLDNFFKCVSGNRTDKKLFIYDGKTAFFTNKLEPDDKFINNPAGVKLYYRGAIHEKMIYPTLTTGLTYVPLIKSSFQKAIRLGNTLIAKKSLYSLMCLDPMALLRRLPIIVLEDACLIEGLSIIIWLMMACKDYTITRNDYIFISDYIECLCNSTKYYYSETRMQLEEITHEKIVSMNNPIETELLGLFYRYQYGGMNGDLIMIRNAIDYYRDNPNLVSIVERNTTLIELPLTIDDDNFIDSSIDYHPFPNIINQIYDSVNGVITKDDIKKVIWYTQSANNYRKQYILERSHKEKISKEWRLIKPILKEIRQNIKNQYR